MFETTVVESRKQKVGIQRIMTLPVSVAIHVVVVVAVVVLTSLVFGLDLVFAKGVFRVFGNQ